MSRRVRELASEIRTLRPEDPDRVRRRITEALLEVAGGDLAAVMVGTPAGHGWVPTNAVWTGSLDGDAALRRLQKWARRAGQPTGSSLSDPTSLRPIELRAFVEEQALFPPEAYESPFIQNALHASGLFSQQRLLVFEGRRLVCWAGLFRTRGTEKLGRTERRRLAPLVPAVKAALTAADRAERRGLPTEVGDVVVRADGRVELASSEARKWLAHPSVRRALTRAVRRMDRGEMPDEVGLGPALARMVRLEGYGETRYLACIRPMPSLVLPPAQLLTPRQREIAELATRGSSAREIAELLETSPETVRTHLRNIYQRLEVGSRAELTRALTEPTAVRPDGR